MVTIRDGVVPDDVERCAEVWVAAIERRDGSVDHETMARRVRESFASPLVRFAVATAPRFGFATVEQGTVDAAEAYLHYLAVDPRGIGSGVGCELLADAIAHATAAGFTTLALDVKEDNVRAISLYERAGFKAAGTPVRHATAAYRMQSYILRLA
ncbi:GNAT family N-acetyltransferase [Demequina capsici]|uniref:GNAT family N-acetyltransferase n=1 Tax=Demequina capsici TaxID=3075620 RepID=A0AA96FDJ6_9MICO|nr:GNAT family N-acetyltransferase [Demequina sp. PMTSA13]WNM27619.1 GNAT family N-acetyltransferase [Demequina sp. PMTSA13]